MNTEATPAGGGRPKEQGRWGFRAAVLGVGLIALFLRLAPGPAYLDDAYITYRIAENIVAGRGFVYNEGERLQSTTAPGYAVLLATLGRGGLPVPALSFALNALAGMIATLLLFQAGRKISGDSRVAFAGALLYAVFPGSVIYSISGMETAVFEMLLIACLSTFLFEKDWLAAILAGFLPLFRPEGLIVSMVVGLGLIVVKRNRVWAYGAVAFLPLIIWLLWATAYYGTPIPHSVSEKQRFFTDPRFAVGFFGFLRQWIYHFYSLFWDNPIDGWRIVNTRYIHLLLGAFPFAVGYLYQLGREVAKRSRAIPICLAGGFYALICLVGQAGLPFPWYFMPTVGLLAAPALWGLASLGRDLLRAAGRPAAQPLAATAVLILTLALAVLHLGKRYHGLPRPQPAALRTHVFSHREPVYEEVGRWLNQQPGERSEIVLCSEVGAVGYHCRFRVWDQHLTTPPWIAERGSALVDKHRPRFITFMAIYPPVPELENQPLEVRIGTNAIAYRQVLCLNRSTDPAYTLPRERHNVLVYERED